MTPGETGYHRNSSRDTQCILYVTHAAPAPNAADTRTRASEALANRDYFATPLAKRVDAPPNREGSEREPYRSKPARMY